jgi:hypothetical protein
MRSGDCERARGAVEPGRRAPALPDWVALHLDECRECRRLFDAARVQLDPEAFERLGEARRQALVAALAAARAAGGRRRAIIAAAVAAVLAGVLALGGLVYFGPARGGREETVASALVEDHIRYLRSPERVTSEPPRSLLADLETYVDFPVRLPDLPHGSLTGGRRCYLLGRRAALFFFDTPEGPLSFFALESGGFEPPGRTCGEAAELACRRIRGYEVVSWEEAGILYAVVGPDSGLVERAAGAAREAMGGRP